MTFSRIEGSDLLLLALIFAALVVRLLLSPPIWHHGEAREGLVVQGVVHDHQWILPFRNGQLPSKPPLFHWVAALVALPLGLSDFSVRLPSAIAAEIMVIATFLMGRAMGGRKTAWLAVGALLGMYEFWDSGTQARVDMVLAACVTLAIVSFFFWYPNGNQMARVSCYIASACAVLAKGPVGVVLPGLVIAGFFAAEGRFRFLWTFWSWPLAGLVLLIDVGWYALAYQVGGDAFLRFHVLRENVDRFLGAGGFSTRFTNLDLLIWFATQTLPWNLVLLRSLIRRLRGEREDPAGRFLHVWWIAIFGFFALSTGARDVYLLPAYPAIALLAARAMGAMIPSFAERSHFDSVQKVAIPATGLRRVLTPKTVGIAIALFDLAMMLVNPMIWRDVARRNARLALVEKVGAIVPSSSRLFAVPEVPGTDVIVIAYRLERRIDRKLITCADRNDYFLLPIASGLPAAETKVLATSEGYNVALVSVLTEQSAAESQNNSEKVPSLSTNEQKACAS